MKILVVSQHYYPEIGAPSKRITELTRLWANQGHEVIVYSTYPNYPYGNLYNGYSIDNDYFEEEIDSVTVIRNKIKIDSYSSKIGRLKSYLSFIYYSFRNVKNLPKDIDVIVTTIGPIFVSIIGNYLSKKLNVPNILEFRDITYKQMQATNFSNKGIIEIIRNIELHYARKSQCNVTVTNSYKRILEENGIKQRIKTIPNGYLFENKIDQIVDLSAISHIYSIINKEKRIGKKIIGYFGILGVSQNLEQIVSQFKNNSEFSFLIIGSGSKEGSIKKIISEEKIDNVFIFPAIEEKYIKELYKEVDFNLIKLENKKEFSSTIPSKLFQILGSGGLPIFIGPMGEVTAILDDICELLYINDSKQIFDKLTRLICSGEDIESLKIKGKKMVLEKYNRENHANEYLSLMNEII